MAKLASFGLCPTRGAPDSFPSTDERVPRPMEDSTDIRRKPQYPISVLAYMGVGGRLHRKPRRASGDGNRASECTRTGESSQSHHEPAKRNAHHDQHAW